MAQVDPAPPGRFSGPGRFSSDGGDGRPTHHTRFSSTGQAGFEKSGSTSWYGAVYFPKYVCINNTRLALLYYVLTALLVISIGWYFLMNSQYYPPRETAGFVHVCGNDGEMCRPTFDVMRDAWDADRASLQVCTNPAKYTYWRSLTQKFIPLGCAAQCGGNAAVSAPQSCYMPADTIITGPNMAFVPTYVTETLTVPRPMNSTTAASLPCPAHFDMDDNGIACTNISGRFMPGVDGLRVHFTHEFAVSPDSSAFVLSKEKKANSKSKKSLGFDAGLKTVFFSHDGSKVREYQAGDWINPTVAELLQHADYEDVGARGSLSLDHMYNIFSENRVPVNLFHSSAGTPVAALSNDEKRAILRVTGASLTVDLAITDDGECVHVKLQKRYDVGSGPVACMFVHAERTWTQEGRSYPTGTDGTVREVQHTGIRIKFRLLGKIGLFDLNALSRSFTVAVVWIQIPLVVVYYFTVLFLGHLSAVYSKVLHQELSLGDATKGLATRLVSHSAAFMELQDTPEGITKGRLLSRFRKILATNSSLDDTEIKKYADYVFEGMQSMGEGEVVINDQINIEEFCTACCTNEPLNFEALVTLFDKDRKITFLENMFLDDTIRGVINESKKDLDKEEDDRALDDVDRKTKVALEASAAKLSACNTQVDELEAACNRVLKHCQQDLEQNIPMSSRAAAIALERRAQGKHVVDPICDFVPTEDPKPDQRESGCSVADEDDPGRGFSDGVDNI